MPFPRSFHFLRHGETEWNRAQRIHGRTDIPLSPEGRAQAEAAAARIRTLPVTCIVASPLLRARETAEIAGAHLQAPVILDPRLSERDYGVFEGRGLAEFDAWRAQAAEKFPGKLEQTGYPCPEGAEPYAAFQKRVAAAVAGHMADFPAENILVVAHGGVYRALNRLLGLPLDHSPNAVPYLFEKADGTWTAREI